MILNNDMDSFLRVYNELNKKAVKGYSIIAYSKEAKDRVSELMSMGKDRLGKITLTARPNTYADDGQALIIQVKFSRFVKALPGGSIYLNVHYELFKGFREDKDYSLELSEV